ncbi:DUF2911 domain-containing protein [Salinimicrobium flavum]|uniref:DUF2911 domain-containing protein n=1 Tax=Salinimicrobium flavum TaxID=1737065 RepID=A0ABW5IXQ0_9FLAO
MRKILERSFIGVIVLIMAIMVSYFIFKINTKSYSPEDTVTYQKDGLSLEVFYNRPYKKDRQIFGGLVPFDQVWRTGANEATTFTTTKDILVDGSLLPEGKYTLWTIPMEDTWKVIFNSEMYPWGITANEVPFRVADYDVLTIEVDVTPLDEVVEQFTISFTEAYNFVMLNLAWDKTMISIPIKDAEKVQRVRSR